MNWRKRTVLFLATGCHSGNLPWAPGTFGTVVGLPLAYLLSSVSRTAAVAGAVIFIPVAVFIAHEAQTHYERKDPGPIVIDEIAGILVALAGLPFTPAVVVAGFFLFRTLDILKPFPIGAVDRKLTGGAGIVLDDVLAGIVVNIVLRTVLTWVS